MTKLFILLVMALLPFLSEAQLAKVMSKYHEKNGVTVTQLDKSLYGLYERTSLSPEVKDMLQKLDEVNILNLDLIHCEPDLSNKMVIQLRSILDNPEKYKLVKSRNDGFGKQLIYSQSKNGSISNLVVWNQTQEHIDIVELQGNIQLDRVALLAKALNLKGLNSLSALSPNADTNVPRTTERSLSPNDLMGQMQQMTDMMQKHFGKGIGIENDSIQHKDDFFDPFGSTGFFGDFSNLFGGFENFDGLMPEDISKLFKEGDTNGKVEKYFQSFGDGENISSNSVQITEENGKTKIKIDSKNSDITYVIDGKKAPKDNIQMPEKILNVNIIPLKEDPKKAYLFVTSQNQIGQFTSFKNGVLTFKYNNQEYNYNLDKVHEPILVIDGRLARSFDIAPSAILQIRPISTIEKEMGYYPNAEVIINTK